MNNEPNTNMESVPVKSLGEMLLDIVTVIVRRRRFVIWVVLLSTLTTGTITMFMPKWYKATASVFPAEQADLFPGLEGVSSLVRSFSGSKKLSSLTGPSEVDRYMAILKSEQVLKRIVKEFNLTSIYGYSDAQFKTEKTLKELIGNTELDLQDEGNLTVSVYDRDPLRAAQIANYYIELLNKTNSELQAQNARGNRMFVEQRYNKNILDLKNAEDSLKAFQLRHGVLAMPEQTEASIKAGAEVYGQLAKKEIELDILNQTLVDGHQNIVEKQIEVDAIKRRLREMSEGTMLPNDEMNVFVPFRQTPELAIEYIRRFRDVEIQYKILQFITPLYEQSKVEENRNTPSVVVLDTATPPERKAKPKVMMFTLLAFVISSLISLVIVFTVESIQKMKEAMPERYFGIVSALRSDWFGLKLKSKAKDE